MMNRQSCTVRWLFVAVNLQQLLVVTVSAQKCDPCAYGFAASLVQPFRPGEIGYDCTAGVALADTLINGTEDCLSLQLGTYQGFCCDEPPPEYCTLCEGGSKSFNDAKKIPGNADRPLDYTCGQVDRQNVFLQDPRGLAYGDCGETNRRRSAAWCECENTEIVCTLQCDDGNAPPDLSKSEPIFGETCDRFMYEYSTLTAEECPNAAELLQFDAKAFCCNEDPPENCSICPEGSSLIDPNKEVRTEKFGNATCGEIEMHASYLPGDLCDNFINSLLDNPFGAAGACCEDPNENAASSSSSMSWVLSLAVSIAITALRIQL